MAKRKPEHIKKGDVCAVVLAHADCDSPLFIGKATVGGSPSWNDAEFAGTYFMDDPDWWPVHKVSFDTFKQSYNFGNDGRSSGSLRDHAETLGYVWVWTVLPSKTFKDSSKR